eukprot:1424177-Prymnesium_polylepis.1
MRAVANAGCRGGRHPPTAQPPHPYPHPICTAAGHGHAARWRVGALARRRVGALGRWGVGAPATLEEFGEHLELARAEGLLLEALLELGQQLTPRAAQVVPLVVLLHNLLEALGIDPHVCERRRHAARPGRSRLQTTRTGRGSSPGG